jgi:excisionase family DNA binding protein
MVEITSETHIKVAYSVAEISAMTSLSKSYVRNEIREKRLKAKRVGSRVLILSKDLQEYLESKEDWKPLKNQNSENFA